MKASTGISRTLRFVSVISAWFRYGLMAAGVILIIAMAGIVDRNPGLLAGLRAVLPEGGAAALMPVMAAGEDSPDELIAAAMVSSGTPVEELSPRLRGVLDYVAKRYRVADEALRPVFAAVQTTSRELRLDPLLILAVIGVESGYNPFAQSVHGAQGLMQVVPRFHLDKLPGIPEPTAFLDPMINVHVGARVLEESIRRQGGVEEGLQQFAGALDDPERRYAAKVLAERQRLEQAVARRGVV